jgi:hypothetical protein
MKREEKLSRDRHVDLEEMDIALEASTTIRAKTPIDNPLSSSTLPSLVNDLDPTPLPPTLLVCLPLAPLLSLLVYHRLPQPDAPLTLRLLPPSPVRSINTYPIENRPPSQTLPRQVLLLLIRAQA